MVEGLCACGCGQMTPLVKWHDPKRGAVKGEHRKCLPGHRKSERGIENSELECNTCHKLLPVSSFTLRTKETYAGKCSVCRLKTNRRKQYARYYKLTEEDVEKLMEKQESRCAICLHLFSETDKSRRMCIDHDHNSQKVRGLLCHSCNSGLGLLGDNIKQLLKAVEYLENKLC